ncbi:von Willebrand factor c domain-containing protein 2-like protein [Plakobranchus ocellatus]|uniref:von Willebrand factor c domain-containing protein 2-like protein n=1 Tax=Plakobranchus ocellatus TaxID=259542 RepID=A0AAV3ZDK5_9GAST|nr:von Willebrand factor c domain-containing protein 2-like protein [Plakobranchus ocellatus]
MRSVPYIIVILSVLSTYPPADAVSKRKRATNGCVKDGVLYPFKFVLKPEPCQTCTCELIGRFVCMYAWCLPSRCVDADKSKCCPTCPNGENCRRSDGVAVSVDSYTFSKAGFCSCTDDLAGKEASCYCPSWPISALIGC